MARPGRLLLALVTVVALLTSGCSAGGLLGGGLGSTADTTAPGGSGSGSVELRHWLSGAAGFGVPSGDFGRWRGSPVGVVATWADNNGAMVGLAQLRPGGEYGDWQGSMDIAIGAIDPGESWRQAAEGAYDARWRDSLTNLQQLRGARPGTTFIRFAHEMNGDWYPWSVDSSSVAAFIQAWRRFRALQEEIFPDAKLVFGVNRESIGTGMDWRLMFPGARYVDVLAVDYYNQSPCVTTQKDWDINVVQKDGFGGPRGLERHRQFAKSVGLPLAVPAWGGNADQCDSPVYVQNMYDFFRTHAGEGPGQLLYESYFNIDWEGESWRLFGSDRMPLAAARYRELF
jgi:hypothetical protein